MHFPEHTLVFSTKSCLGCSSRIGTSIAKCAVDKTYCSVLNIFSENFLFCIRKKIPARGTLKIRILYNHNWSIWIPHRILICHGVYAWYGWFDRGTNKDDSCDKEKCSSDHHPDASHFFLASFLGPTIAFG